MVRSSPMWRGMVAGAALVGVLAAGSARAQVDSREGIALQNQIYQLRQELQQMREQMARSGGGSSSSRGGTFGSSSTSGDMVAQLLTRVDALEEQVRQLRGRIDESQNQTQRQNAELAKRIDDMEFRMQPGAGAATPASATPPRPAPATTPTQAPTTAPAGSPAQPAAASSAPRPPERALQDGNAALARRDYAAAEQAAREVLANRTSPRAYDAQFLLAQALAGQRQFPQAAIAYDDTYNRSRRGAYAADSLLGLANALTAINEKRAACDTLTRLGTEFPQPRADLREPISAARQRAGCR
jgi:TolA-binding protein